MNLVNGLAHQVSLVARWIEHPASIWEAMGSIPVWDSEFFSLSHARDNYTYMYHFYHVFYLYLIQLEEYSRLEEKLKQSIADLERREKQLSVNEAQVSTIMSCLFLFSDLQSVVSGSMRLVATYLALALGP